MIMPFIDSKIRRAFSNAADQYEMLTSVHKDIARELTNKVIRASVTGNILDVGMGTGWMTDRLHTFLPEATIVGLDFADGMIKQAKSRYHHLTMIQADANHLPFKDQAIDAIVSNFAYQWVDGLDQAFGQCRNALKKDGKIMMTMFGFETFNELFLTLDKVANRGRLKSAQSFKRLAKRKTIDKALAIAGFKNIELKSELIKIRFQDMFDLLKWVKSIGANCLGTNIYLGNEYLRNANQYYVEHYKDRMGVYATLEVVWVEARV